MVSAGTLSGFMGFRLAPCLVLWDFKTDGWPPVPISNPPPQPRPPWIALLLRFRLAPCLVLWDFKTDGWPPVPISNPPPQPRPPWIELLLRFRLAPCLVLWDFKTDGWPLSRSQRLPHSRDFLGLQRLAQSRDLLGLSCCWALVGKGGLAQGRDDAARPKGLCLREMGHLFQRFNFINLVGKNTFLPDHSS